MRRSLLYCVGIPGSGKSTLLAAALKGLVAVPVLRPFAHVVYGGKLVQLGSNRPAFSGTDALPMNVQPTAIAWLTSPQFPYDAVIAEGDRLANEKFFTALQNAGWAVSVVLLDTPDAVAAFRRELRGSDQNPAWIAGRVTKIHNLVAAGWTDMVLDGTQPIDVLVAQLRQHPMLQPIWLPLQPAVSGVE